jgi:hypothetical protein
MDVEKSEFDPLMEKLMKNLSEHIDEEEVLPTTHTQGTNSIEG